MHIYREISTSQVKRNDSMMRHGSNPQIPQRSSSLALDRMEKKPSSPAELFDRYMKSAYNPKNHKTDYYASRDNLAPQAANELDSPRRSFRQNDARRPLSPMIVTNENGVFYSSDSGESSMSSPVHKIRSRNSIRGPNKENGWINVGPEFSIKPSVANGLQPLINVTIVQPSPQIPEPDYNNNESNFLSGGNVHLTDRSSDQRLLNSRSNSRRGIRASGSFRQSLTNNNNGHHQHHGQSQVGYASEGFPNERESLSRNINHSSQPPQPVSPAQIDKTLSKIGSFLARRSSSVTRNPQPQLAQQSSSIPAAGSPSSHHQRTISRATGSQLKSSIKKRSYSQGGLERKKNVTFNEFAVVFS